MQFSSWMGQVSKSSYFASANGVLMTTITKFKPCCGMTFRVFLFRSIPVFSFSSPELFFASRGCMRRILAAVNAQAARQTPRVSLSRSQLSYAHVRSTGSCVSARVFSCDYSFDKRVNKTFFGVKIRFRVFFYSRSTICCCGRRH